MDLRRIQHSYCTLAFATLSALGGLSVVSAAHAANGATASSIQSQYELDVQRCNSGQTNQSRDVCLQEAGAARDEARRKRLEDGQSANYTNNAVERCLKLPEQQRDDCLLQMQSPSSVKGSVQSGGVLRETVIPVPAQPTPAMPGAMTPSVTPAVPGTMSPGVAPGAVPGATLPPPTPLPGSPAAPVPLQR